MNLKDILFWLSMLVVACLLVSEFIPDHVKKYWNYIRQNRKDHKAGRSRKWIWTFKK